MKDYQIYIYFCENIKPIILNIQESNHSVEELKKIFYKDYPYAEEIVIKEV